MSDINILKSKEVGRATVTSDSDKGRVWVIQSIPNAISHMGKAYAYIEIEDVDAVCAACRISMLSYSVSP